MDFTTLMTVATAKQKSKDKIKINRYSLDLPAPKKEAKEVSRSDAVKKLIQEKENEKQMKEKSRREKEKSKEPEEKKKPQFRIPKKKPEDQKTSSTDKEKLINSLFDDDDDDEDVGKAVNNELNASSEQSLPGSDHSPKSSSHSTSDNHKHSSSHKPLSSSSSSSSKDKEKSSHSSHESSKSSNSSLSGDKKSHGSSSSSRSKSSSSSHSKSSSSSHSKSSSSSSKHGTKSSSSSKSESRHTSSSSSKHKSSSRSSSSSKSSSSVSKSSASASSPSNTKPAASTSPSSAAEQPIALSKHHLKPVAERHVVVPSAQLSEKEKILAKLAAIKQRTLDAIHKESQTKGRKSRGEKSMYSRSSKSEKEDERVKSKEIVRDIVSSDEEDDAKAGMPSVIDIMLDEHQSKLERDKITRMAKQAWERATKKGGDDDSILAKKKKKLSRKPALKSSRPSSDNHHNRKRRDHSLSPDPDCRKRSKVTDIERKKPKIVRHAGNLAPPPPDFQAILAMAAKKVKDPPPKAGGLATIPKKKKKEIEERPMTQEEKERKARVKTKDYQQWLKYGGKQPGAGKENSNSSADEEDTRRNNSKHSRGNERSDSDRKHINKNGNSRDTAMAKKPGHVSSGMKSNREITVNENVLVCGPAEDDEDYDSGDDAVRRGKGQQQPSANPFDRIYNSVHKKKSADQHTSRKRRIEEYEEEESEESDLEGFIDDGEGEDKNYSKHIAKIFGYNKNRYADEDDDLSDMEASFATVMAEEKRSAKIGLMEDLEDMKREEEELKMKAMLKKKMRR